MPENLASKRDRVVEIVKAEGPLLPITIAKKLDLSTTFASAILSELVDNKMLKITNVKYGGSPFYYTDGQESKLQNLMKHLNQKDLGTAELLRNKKILRDRDLDTLQRFGLRQMKDFAKPVTITVNSENHLFWKWYLAEDNDVRNLINEYLEAHLPRVIEPETAEVKNAAEIKNLKEEQIKLERIYEQELKKEAKTQIKAEAKAEAKTEIKTKTEKVKVEKIKEEKPKEEEVKIKQEKAREINIKEESSDHIGSFFVNSQVDILDQKIIKKNKEINYIAGINTDLGKGIFFLKYKDKRKISEADLSLAMHEAGKLPLIFLSTGELNKKARELLGTEFKGVIFKKI